MSPADHLGPFDGTVVDSVADDHGINVGELRTILSRHQTSMADLPGIENLRYEWRKRHGGTDLGRTESAYFVAVPESVWGEFGDALDLDTRQRDTLRAVHERQTRRTLDVDPPAQEVTYVVLARE